MSGAPRNECLGFLFLLFVPQLCIYFLPFYLFIYLLLSSALVTITSIPSFKSWYTVIILHCLYIPSHCLSGQPLIFLLEKSTPPRPRYDPHRLNCFTTAHNITHKIYSCMQRKTKL